MNKWLRRGGCLTVFGAIALVGVFIHAMGLTKYALAFVQVLLGLSSSPDALSANWAPAGADVVTIARRSDENYRDLASIMLRFRDANGRERIETFEVFSPSKDLGLISAGDRLEIEVCRHDPTVVKSSRFLLSEQRKCVEDAGR